MRGHILHTEIEKGKMTERTCAECLQDLAKMYARISHVFNSPTSIATIPNCMCKISLHMTHDDTKDKPFELEMGWICEASGWQFQKVPDALR